MIYFTIHRYYEPALLCNDGVIQDEATGYEVKNSVCFEMKDEAAEVLGDFADANQAIQVATGSFCKGPTKEDIVNVDEQSPCTQGKFIPLHKPCNIQCLYDYLPTRPVLTCDMKTLLLQPPFEQVQCLSVADYEKWYQHQSQLPCPGDVHCNGHGTGSRNQTTLLCDCACDPGFTGTYCNAPYSIFAK